jgi:hypothetical protein
MHIHSNIVEQNGRHRVPSSKSFFSFKVRAYQIIHHHRNLAMFHRLHCSPNRTLWEPFIKRASLGRSILILLLFFDTRRWKLPKPEYLVHNVVATNQKHVVSLLAAGDVH